MSQKTRIMIVVVVLVIVAVILAVVGLVTQAQTAQAPSATPQPGMIHVYVDGVFVANVFPSDILKLPAASFVDKEQGKTQSGCWVRDVIRLYVKENQLLPQSQITVTGLRKGTEKKSAAVNWTEALDPANNLLFDFANDGQSVKMAGTLDRLSTRDNWIQGITQIEVKIKP